MFVAWRDVRFAKGRFALIISVVVMITLLVGMLSGLMTGLRGQSISAIEGINADRIVFSAPVESSAVSFTDSSINNDQLTAWSKAASTGVQPIGISMNRLSTGASQKSVSLFGVEPGFSHDSGNVVPTSQNEIVLSAGAADQLGLKQGDQVSLNGQSLVVGSVTGDAWYSHAPVAWVQLATWQQVADSTGGKGEVATVLAVSGLSNTQVDDLAQQTNTRADSLKSSFSAVNGFQAENGSLMAMLGMLLAISALVIGAFFTVWTIQRTSDIAILKALGASTWSLARDALGQATLVLAIGIGIGLALTAIIGSLITSLVPFVVSLSTTLIPGALLMGLGVLGAAFALRTVVKSDPLTAIAANR